MGEAVGQGPAPADLMPQQDTLAPVDEYARLDQAARGVLAGVVTEPFDMFKQRTEGSFSDYFKEKAGRVIDSLHHQLPEIVGMTIYGSTARGEAKQQKEDGSSSDIDGVILVDVDKNPNLKSMVMRNDSPFAGADRPAYDSLSMDQGYTFKIMSILEPSIRDVTGRERSGNESDDISIRPISDQIIVEQIEAMCETAKLRKEMQAQGEADPNKLPLFASRNIRALFQVPISGDFSEYQQKVIKTFQAMEQVYGPEVRDTAWAMHAFGVNQFHDGRNPNATPVLESDFKKYVESMVPVETQNQSPKLINEVPSFVAENKIEQGTRHIIDKVPSLKELQEGLAYKGENGELEDVSRLLEVITEIDPDKKLSDKAYRAELIKHATGTEALLAITAINQKLYGAEGSNISDTPVILSKGSGEERQVGFIGLDPSIREEVFTAAFEAVKGFVEKGDMERAGLLAANTIVGMQMFNDGNKRTARAIYQMIAWGYDGSHYDTSAMRETLAHTYEARRTFFYNATTHTANYVLEDVPKEDRNSMDWAMTYWTEINYRPLMKYALGNIKNPDLRDRTVSVFQQQGFGAKYLRQIDPVGITTAANERDVMKLERAVIDTLSKLTDEQALKLIEQDKIEKKNYFLRVIKSTTGEKLLPAYDSEGNPRKDFAADMAA